jgi:hypothetical protein
MNRQDAENYLAALDQRLERPTELVVYGSAALMLLGEVDRTSLDIGIAGPYSSADFGDLSRAAKEIGVPVNPSEDFAGDHLEWVSPLLLALPVPDADAVVLWQGARLTVKTVPPAQLVASKLIRYDEIDQSDVRFLCSQSRLTYDEVAAAVEQLPPRFRNDLLVRDNLESFRTDFLSWEPAP